MSTATPMLRDAVHHSRPTSKRGLLERLFTLWFGGFVYNQIWEDPRVDAEALQLSPEDRVLTISSGGCNVLNYLIHDPQRIVAVDLNTCHMSLTRLKLTALKQLPTYEDFYNFFGVGRHEQNLENYFKYIRDHLDPTTRKFWESGSGPRRIGRKRIRYFEKGLYDHAKFGKFLRFAHGIARVSRKDPTRYLDARTPEQQQEFFDDVVAPFFDNKFVRLISKNPVTVYSLGIPPSQHDVMKEECNGNFVGLFRERLRKLVCDFPQHENYFAWQAFGRKYDHDAKQAIPDYLREDYYQQLRTNVDRIETHIAAYGDYLRAQPDNTLNKFILLDSQDWMPDDVIEDLWSQIARVGEPGSRIIFRTAGLTSPIEAALPAELMANFKYHPEESQRLHDQDRSAIYGMFHLYTLEK